MPSHSPSNGSSRCSTWLCNIDWSPETSMDTEMLEPTMTLKYVNFLEVIHGHRISIGIFIKIQYECKYIQSESSNISISALAGSGHIQCAVRVICVCVSLGRWSLYRKSNIHRPINLQAGKIGSHIQAQIRYTTCVMFHFRLLSATHNRI